MIKINGYVNVKENGTPINVEMGGQNGELLTEISIIVNALLESLFDGLDENYRKKDVQMLALQAIYNTVSKAITNGTENYFHTK